MSCAGEAAKFRSSYMMCHRNAPTPAAYLNPHYKRSSECHVGYGRNPDTPGQNETKIDGGA